MKRERHESLDCAVCLEPLSADQGLLNCQHVFCFPCIETWRKRKGKVFPCPLCKRSSNVVAHAQALVPMVPINAM